MLSQELTTYGFDPAAVLHWKTGEAEFHFEPIDDKYWYTKNVIYIFVDLERERLLYVGHTGQEFRARFADYKRWLNRQRMGDNDTPILHKWLACLAECEPSRIQVWVKASNVEKELRELEEKKWIQHFVPVLNKK